MSAATSESGNTPFNFEAENKYLKVTISALREQMESLQNKQAEEIQRTKAGSQDQISQLQTIRQNLTSNI